MISGTIPGYMAYRRERGRTNGFTLVELMVVVAIVGALASIAVPSFVKNSRRARMTEATVQLNRIYNSSRNYIIELHGAAGSASPVTPQFPNTEPKTPAAACCTFAG